MLTLLILLVSFSAAVYLYVTRDFDYWRKRGIFYLKPTPFIGNLGPILTGKCCIGEFLKNIYNDHKDKPYVGIFLTDKPCLVVRDLELVDKILRKDFKYFGERIFTASKKTDPIGAKSLFSTHGKEWKNTRSKVVSIFTSSKQMVAYEDMIRVGYKFNEKLNNVKSVEIIELAYCFTANIISDTLLGLDGKAILDPDNDSMRKLGKQLFGDTTLRVLTLNLSFLAPELLNALNIAVISGSSYDIIKNAVQSALKLKNDPKNYRGDYMDGFLGMKEGGSWEGNDGEIIVPDDLNIVSQAFMFFTGAFETGSNAMTYCLYEVAKDQIIQDKLRSEINAFTKDSNESIKYEALNEMSYMNKFIAECLRKNLPFPFLDRKCSMDYKVPGTDFVIEKGTRIFIPTLGFHRDEKYYPNPEVLIPERYDDMEAMKEKPNFSFGFGSRLCVGMRFAQQFIKVGLINCLREYKITVSEKTPKVLKMNPNHFGNSPDGKVYIDLHRIKDIKS